MRIPHAVRSCVMKGDSNLQSASYAVVQFRRCFQKL